MKTKLSAITLLFLFTCSMLRAQPMFNRDYNTPGYECGSGSHVQTEDDGILFLSRMFVPTSAVQSAVMFRTDAMGNLVWELDINMVGNFEDMSNVVRSPDSSYFFATYEFGGAFHIFRVDAGGTLVMNNKITVPSGYVNNGIPVCLARNDGSFLIAGTFMDVATSEFVWVMMNVDHNGNMLWSQLFNRNIAKMHQHDMDTCSNGDIVLLGQWYDNSSISIGPNLSRITPGGSLLWSRSYFEYGTNMQPRKVCVMPGDFIFVAGYTYTFTSGDDEGFVSRFTGQGNEIRTMRYGGTDLLVSDVLESGHHLLVLGKSDNDGFLYEIDSSGLIGWGKIYQNHVPWDIAHSATCGYTITSSSQINGLRAFSANLSGNSCVDSGIDLTKTALTIFEVVVGNESTLPMPVVPVLFPIQNNPLVVTTNCLITGIEETNVPHRVSVFPNPASSFVYVNSTDKIDAVEITDVHGRLIMTTQCSTNNVAIDICDLANGIYFLRAKNCIRHRHTKDHCKLASS